ncbi:MULTISPECIES: hypothetical protein [Sphingobacterium]|uniref:DUF4340 domain-containing protein n=1 Tax=Sphingobacterium hotanense TaxID=649196 RepID=A0ABT7NT93_9SPHI|nr:MULTISPECIES: hypothetical protein [Sphingobacterium]MDM1050432.1 hypothetical protein [Sphingobacterium hotanense]
MKWLKKTFIILTGLIAVLAISLFIYKEIRASKAKDLMIPSNTQALIQLNVDGLVSELMGNAISNPNTYFFGKRDSTRVKKPKLWETGLAIPSTLFLFSDKKESDQYYTVQRVSDINRFKRFLKSNMRIDLDSVSTAVEGGFSYFQKKNLALLMNDERIAFSIGRDSTDQSPKLRALLQDNQSTWVNALNWSKQHTEDRKGDILWSNVDKNWFTFDFLNGSVHVDGLLKSDKWRLSDAPKQLKPIPNAVLSAYLDADLSEWIKAQDSLLHRLNVPVDSIYQYYGGYADLHWLAQDVKQEESIVSYEYDDNFEMKEVVQLQEIDAPNLLLRLKASPHLLGYLPEKLFYKFNKSNQADLISLFTGKEGSTDTIFDKAKLVFNLNYSKSPSVTRHLSWLPFFDRWQKIKLEGRARDQRTMQLHGYLILPKEKIHALFQLLND